MTGPVRGWCPSLFAPMATGDGWLVRVKPPGGRLLLPAARALAAAARRGGNGLLELTNRAALQARGFSESTLAGFRETVLAYGLASPDPAIERRRTVALSPFASPPAAALAAELEQWIAATAALAALPAKFGFAVAAPERDPGPMPGDIRLTPVRDGWRIALSGSSVAALTPRPLPAVRIVTQHFLDRAATMPGPPGRMADLWHHAGPEALFEGTDTHLVPAGPTPGAVSPKLAGPLGDAFALALPFGAFTADQLEAAADLAERFGGTLRLSPWRALVLTGVAALDVLATEARAAGFIVDPADPRLAISACPGAPACASAHAPVRAHAATLAARRPQGHVHVSGCAKGCAHPGPADVTLVATQGGYALIRSGRAGDPPEAKGLTLPDAIPLLCAEVP